MTLELVGTGADRMQGGGLLSHLLDVLAGGDREAQGHLAQGGQDFRRRLAIHRNQLEVVVIDDFHSHPTQDRSRRAVGALADGEFMAEHDVVSGQLSPSLVELYALVDFEDELGEVVIHRPGLGQPAFALHDLAGDEVVVDQGLVERLEVQESPQAAVGAQPVLASQGGQQHHHTVLDHLGSGFHHLGLGFRQGFFCRGCRGFCLGQRGLHFGQCSLRGLVALGGGIHGGLQVGLGFGQGCLGSGCVGFRFGCLLCGCGRFRCRFGRLGFSRCGCRLSCLCCRVVGLGGVVASASSGHHGQQERHGPQTCLTHRIIAPLVGFRVFFFEDIKVPDFKLVV